MSTKAGHGKQGMGWAALTVPSATYNNTALHQQQLGKWWGLYDMKIEDDRVKQSCCSCVDVGMHRS